ncbi:hypothetical protein AP1_0125 [Aeromonas phage AP1]|nr:hypothetical protein AP1_0125 [Aeromonas phage AP1]
MKLSKAQNEVVAICVAEVERLWNQYQVDLVRWENTPKGKTKEDMTFRLGAVNRATVRALIKAGVLIVDHKFSVKEPTLKKYNYGRDRVYGDNYYEENIYRLSKEFVK